MLDYIEICSNYRCVRLSFPLVGNPSVSEERFWTSQNDRIFFTGRVTILLVQNRRDKGEYFHGHDKL
jgi:hypothetical protein